MMRFNQSIVAFCLILVFTGFSYGRATEGSEGEKSCKRNEDCVDERVCADQKCIDPCQLHVCGLHTNCHVTNHVPLCACEPGHTGHPFTGCTPVTDEETPSSSSSDQLKQKKFHPFMTKKNWFQALAYCSSKNMRLATVNSREENEQLINLVKEANEDKSVNWWIGASDLENVGDFRWTSAGTDFTFTNFPPPQPDNTIHANGDKERCVEIRPGWNYHWNDYLCVTHQYFVCSTTD